MQFKLIALAAAFSGTALAQAGESLTPEAVVKSIRTVTEISADTNDLFTDLTPVNIVSVVPRAITNLRDIVTAVTEDVAMIADADAEPFPEAGQKEVCETFRDFVRVHQALLATVIGRNGVLSATPFTAPIAAVFRVIEGGVDSLAFGLIDLVPTCAEKAEADKEDLDKSFKELFDTLG